MNSKKDELQIIGILMKSPNLLSKTDKYNLNISDFSSYFERLIFNAIQGLYQQGAEKIDIIDIENFISSSAASHKIFEQNNGIEYLQDAKELSNEENFDYYYSHLKKINLIKNLKKSGIDTNDIYCEDLFKDNSEDINKKFEELSIKDIIDLIKKKILKVEKNFVQNEVTETISSFDGVLEIFEDIENGEDIGLPIQGKIINEIMSGARKSTLTIRAASSGLGKTRNLVGDACYLAFPFRYDMETETWKQEGSCEKVLLIVTEQNHKEVQKMILAYLTEINESKFRYGNFSEREKKIIKQALFIWEKYKDNLLISKMPNPTNELIKNIIRENVIMNNIEYVFYDYIFIGPALLNEFSGFGLRNDEILLILSTTLKDLASELNIFIMTATQVNAKADDNKDIRNEGTLAGGRATINKADFGFIMAKPTKEELELLKPYMDKYGAPTLVTDVFKVRSGQWTQVRIWSDFDPGTLRKEDLFITNNRLEILEDITFEFNSIKLTEDWTNSEYQNIKKELERIQNETLL